MQQGTETRVTIAPSVMIAERVERRLSTLQVWLQLIRHLAVRDVEIRYKHSLLGLYWAVINPLVTAGIFGFVFGVIFHATSPLPEVPYVVFLLSGLTFWNFFSTGVSSATTSITGSAALLSKVYFPRIVLPTSAILARVIDLAFSLFVLAIFVIAYHVPVYWTAIWVIPLVLLQVIFTMGIGYLSAALNVLYRDVSQLVGLVLMVWMYLSPVMFAPSALQGHGKLSLVLYLNPMGGFLEAERELLFAGHVTDGPYLWVAVIWTVFVVLAGLATFKRIEPLFAEVM